jgi:hypothetical protein
MILDEIIRIADEAKLIAVMEMFEDEVVRFAQLVAAHEREQCAIAAELVPAQWDYPVEIPHPAQACHDCAQAIRKRNTQ